MPKLVVIFNTSLREGYYLVAWKEAIILVMRKPNKADYTSPKAYRPIALLNSIKKIFELVMARKISWLAEDYRLLLNS